MVMLDDAFKSKKLLAEIDEVDKKIKENQLILIQNNVDMTTPLVDDEGFPSATIDVASIRKARHNIICLRNDREKLMNEMSEALTEFHQKNLQKSSSRQTTVHRTSNTPFLKIQHVNDNSPADIAKLKTNDLIIQFGSLHAGNFEGLHQLQQHVQNSQIINITVYRPDSETTQYVYRLELVPKKWEGLGLVGCSFTTVK